MHLVHIPSRWAALRGRNYVHLVQMHGPFPNSVQVGGPLFAGLSFYKEAPTVPGHRRAHECPMASAGAVRCCCAFLRARLAPLTTAHRQGLEKLGKGN